MVLTNKIYSSDDLYLVDHAGNKGYLARHTGAWPNTYFVNETTFTNEDRLKYFSGLTTDTKKLYAWYKHI